MRAGAQTTDIRRKIALNQVALIRSLFSPFFELFYLIDEPMAQKPDRANSQARLLSLKDAAKLTGISVWTLRDLIADGQLRAVQPPGIRRI